ncbi:hypothetical protein CDL12_01469 [Handroanthus impetiginosus]|uniref:RING-CH-type domain-containing protein n=1 Tax=Handroanthus impetiginosus TaxID=429701 RepID=A0A2G9I7P9_9LAMI|nr:hypothetical protein CDL12_01469 [Handroanthus impetiginosus]
MEPKPNPPTTKISAPESTGLPSSPSSLTFSALEEPTELPPFPFSPTFLTPESAELPPSPPSPTFFHIGREDSRPSISYSFPPPELRTNSNKGHELNKNTIPREEAVCRLCFDVFTEDKVIKTKCKCKFTLLHNNCSTKFFQEKGKKCTVCEEEIRPVPVTLCRHCLHSTQEESQLIKEQKFKRLKRWFQRCLGYNNRPVDSKNAEEASIIYAL